jgi:hypothetical protein
MFGWVRRRGATAAELHQQLDAALTQHAAHEQVIADAQDDFYASGSDAAAKKLTEARAWGSTLLEHVERARHLLAEAKEAEAETERRYLEAQVTAIEKQLSTEAVQALTAPFDEREVKLLVSLAGVRADRAELAQQINALGRERFGLLERLGRKPLSGVVVADGRATVHSDPFANRGNAALHQNGVREALARKLGELDESDPRCEHLRKILGDMGTNLPAQHPSAGPQTLSAQRAAAAVALAGRGGAA